MPAGSALMTPAEVATELRFTRKHVYELCAAGEFESFLAGRARRITRASVDAYIARHLTPAPTTNGARKRKGTK